MSVLLFKEESYKIVGVCLNIHKTLGMGLKEINYKDAMEIDFIEKGIPYEREKRFTVKYKTGSYATLTWPILLYLIPSLLRLNLLPLLLTTIWRRQLAIYLFRE